MAFTLQGAGPFLHWLTLGILLVLPVVIAFLLYKVGGLPGAIARGRGHPQADAINICGWMGIVTLVLWPVAMVWAHLGSSRTEGQSGQSGDGADLLRGEMQRASARIAAIESKLAREQQAGAI